MGIEMSQFENFTASSLYCDKCKATMPVRERLLLVLPEKMMAQAIAAQQARRGRRVPISLHS